MKGIFEPVMLGNQTLGPWQMIVYPLNDISWISTIEPQEFTRLPAFYQAKFILPNDSAQPLDTYLDMTGWKKVCGFKLKIKNIIYVYTNVLIQWSLRCNYTSLFYNILRCIESRCVQY